MRRERSQEEAGANRRLRERVLETSEALVEAEGVGALSMREVARRAGVTHQAPYHHFPDKESILAALVESGYDDLSRRLADAIDGARPASSARALLVRTGRAYVGFALERPQVFRLMFRSELVDVRRFAQVAAAGERAHGELERLARRVSTRGDVAVSASLHWSVVHGLACLLLDANLHELAHDPAARLEHAHAVIDAHARQATRRP